jgi:hypothetical protein
VPVVAELADLGAAIGFVAHGVVVVAPLHCARNVVASSGCEAQVFTGVTTAHPVEVRSIDHELLSPAAVRSLAVKNVRRRG